MRHTKVVKVNCLGCGRWVWTDGRAYCSRHACLDKMWLASRKQEAPPTPSGLGCVGRHR